jgi:hypothetical protein
VIMTLLALVVGAGLIAEVRDSDRDWVARHRTEALDVLMPVNTVAGHLPGGTAVNYLGHRGANLDVEEYLWIRINDQRSVHAMVVVPIGGSVQKQLLQLHVANRGASVAELLPKIRLSRTEVSGNTCAAVEQSVRNLSTLIASQRGGRIVRASAHLYRVAWNTPNADQDMVLDDADDPAVRWAKQSLEAIRSCGASR